MYSRVLVSPRSFRRRRRARRALAPGAAQAQKGRIIVSDVEFASYASDKEMAQAIKKQGKTTFKGDGTWSVNFMMFLNAAPGANQINLVYYDVTKKREQVSFSEVGVKPDQKIVLLNGQTLSKEMGFVKGHRSTCSRPGSSAARRRSTRRRRSR